jgi:hypothetical protein
MVKRWGKMQRAKGDKFELRIKNWLIDHGWTARKRGQSAGGEGEPEVSVEEWPLSDFHMECKDHKRIGAFRFVDQAERDASPGKTPMIFMKELRSEVYVMMPLKEWTEWANVIREWGWDDPHK